MAEEKKESPKGEEEKKESPKSAYPEFGQYVAEVVGVIIVAYFILTYILRYSLTGTISWERITSSIMSSYVGPILQRVVLTYITVANMLSLFFLAVMIFSLLRVRQLQRRWYAQINPDIGETQAPEFKNERWQRVVAHTSSDNPSDWRLAILEADIILDELLSELGYTGDTIGDKLKKAHRGDFKTLDYAWEAHRIRNAIAHEGQDFILTQREARRILDLYEMVFREFDYI